MPNIDLILCKTKYCYDTFKDYVPKDKIKQIGWRSADISTKVEKENADWLVLYTDSNYIPLQKLIDSWKLEYPTLNIVFSGVPKLGVHRKNLANIVYYDNISSSKYELLFNQCLVHVCLDEIDNFNHNVNQCQLSGSVPKVINKGPVMDVVDKDNCFFISSTKTKIKNFLGSKYKYNLEDLQSTLDTVIGTSDTTLEIMGNNCKKFALKNQQIFNQRFSDLFSEIFKTKLKKKFNRKDYGDDELPTLSLITTYSSTLKMFKLPILNYTSADYPKDKIEWIVVNNTEDDVESLLPPAHLREKYNITYIQCDKETTLGEQKNMAIEKAKNEVILCMNDDYFYYQAGIRNTVIELLRSEKSCVGCSKVGGFHINRYISVITSANILDTYSQQIQNGTLCFYKSFWEEGQFDKTDYNETKTLIENRISEFGEISWEEKYVILIYTKNELTHKIPDNQKPNGCHYKFSKKVFDFVTSLDPQEKPKEESSNDNGNGNDNDTADSEAINNSDIKEI